MVWVTAQAGRDPRNGELVEGGMAGQMDRAISNLEAILEECGSSLDRVIPNPGHVYRPGRRRGDGRGLRAPLPGAPSSAHQWGVTFLAAEPGTELVRVQIDCVAAVG